MSAGSASEAESLRPAFMQSQPVWIERVFDDPNAVLDLIRDRGPYPTMAEFHQLRGSIGGERVMPWFRTHFTDELLLHSRPWIEAAKAAFSATIVEPQGCILNLNLPLPTGGGVHVDLPIFRGFRAPSAPVWLLMNMSYSGMFHAWMVPIASGLVWFYRGVGGDFEYWPEGPEAPSRRVRSPLWNSGLMSDNEFLWHRVGPIGSKADQDRLAGLRVSDQLHHTADGCWEVRDGARPVARFSADQLRISLLWKARVFKDAAHRASFADARMNLQLDDVVEIYCDDLARRGVHVRRLEDPLNDVAWRETLQANYPPAFAEPPPY